MASRGSNGRFVIAKKSQSTRKRKSSVIIDRNYAPSLSNNVYVDVGNIPKSASRTSWRDGRRIIELRFLLKQLKFCSKCRLGPVPLTLFNIEGELRKGLGGFLYTVRCDSVECNHVNRVPYGKIHRMKTGKGMGCFTANTKLGTAMIDSIGGACKVNNMLATLNLPTIDHKNLDKMKLVETVAVQSEKEAAQDVFSKEMTDISNEESQRVMNDMDGLIDDLGVCPLPDASPSVKFSQTGPKFKLQRMSKNICESGIFT